MGQAEVASRLQVAPITIRDEAEGSGAFEPHERNRVYTPELKIEAVLSYLNELHGHEKWLTDLTEFKWYLYHLL